jgi:hypothetical protein
MLNSPPLRQKLQMHHFRNRLTVPHKLVQNCLDSTLYLVGNRLTQVLNLIRAPLGRVPPRPLREEDCVKLDGVRHLHDLGFRVLGLIFGAGVCSLMACVTCTI